MEEERYCYLACGGWGGMCSGEDCARGACQAANDKDQEEQARWDEMLADARNRPEADPEDDGEEEDGE